MLRSMLVLILICRCRVGVRSWSEAMQASNKDRVLDILEKNLIWKQKGKGI